MADALAYAEQKVSTELQYSGALQVVHACRSHMRHGQLAILEVEDMR
jgi:hypothetical protein